MGDQDRRHAGALEDVADFEREAFAQFDVEIGEGLVEQQQMRLWRQCAGQRDALLLTAGQFVRIAFAALGQSDQFQHFVDALAPRRRRLSAQAEADVVGHRKMRKQCVILKHHADASRFGGDMGFFAGNRDAVEADAARRRHFEARDQSQHGGLAAARRPEQTGNFPRRQVERQIAHHGLLAVGMADTVYFEQ